MSIKIGSFLGLVFGSGFAIFLIMFIRGVSRHRKARKLELSYIDYLCSLEKPDLYGVVVRKLHLGWFASSKFIEVLGYIAQIFVIILCLAAEIFFIILYFNGYEEFFNSRW